MLDNPPDFGGSLRSPNPGYPKESAERARTTVPVFFAALRQRRGTLAATIVLVTLAAFLTLRQVTPLYTATGSLIYEPNVFTMREMQSILHTDPTTDAVMASQAELLQSLRIGQRVAERGNLYGNPEFNPALRPAGLLHDGYRALRGVLGMETEELPETPAPGPRLDRARDQTLMAVRAALHAAAIRGSHVIDVSFTAADPLVAAAAVNNAMDLYIKDQYAAKYAEIARMNELLDKQAAALLKQVGATEQNVAAYRSGQKLSHGMHASTDSEEITHLTEDLVKARADLANANARADAARGHASAAALAAISPSVVQLRAQLDRLAAQMQSQQARLGSAHPEAQGLMRQYAETERALKAEIARVVAATDVEQRAVADRVASLQSELQRAQQDEDREARADIPLDAMGRDLDAARAQLQAVLGQKQQTAQQAAVESSEAHEISEAIPPSEPTSPRTMQVMAAAFAGSVFIGLMLVYALHLADGTIQSGDELRAVVGLPCFARIPQIRRRVLSYMGAHDYAVRRPLSPFADQIRALWSGLRVCPDRSEGGDHGHPHVLAIAAASPSEGKTVVALALGRCAQLGGDQVLVIECDLRQSHFMTYFAAPNASPAPNAASASALGLSDILLGEAEWRDCIQSDPLTGMHVLPAGRPSGAALELFGSEKLLVVLQEVRQHYDLVLLDTPPILAMTEARVVAGAADGTLLCVRWRSTPRATLLNALELLEDAHAHVVGTALTRVDSHAHLRSGYADAEVYRPRMTHYQRG
jgi:succinoglycan biosynthesis transport protein ExoP